MISIKFPIDLIVCIFFARLIIIEFVAIYFFLIIFPFNQAFLKFSFTYNYLRVNNFYMIWHKIKALVICLLLLVSQVQAQEDNTYFFNAEVTRLMDILINSLYTQKEIFLREVISNGSDALDKIRFLALTDPDVLGDTRDLEIRIEINEEEKYIQFRDTGVGMTRAELIQNLGTVAKSGTTNYLAALKEGKINLIGQFGVGFYSTFLVGRKVVVISKSNQDDQHIWTSESAAAYTVEKDSEGNTLGRGTLVRIYLKEDALEFLNHKKVSKLVKRYSEFIDFPIYINNKREVEEDAPIDTPTESEDDLEVKEKTEQTPRQKIKKTVWEWERINNNKAIWLREKEDIYDEDYIDFYKSISKQSNPPMNWVHFNTEGEIVFTAILYLPNRAPPDFYANYNTRKNEVRLYVRRVLIAEQHNDLIPKYLSFVMGVIDSNDISVNVNRETLQQTKSFKVINQRVTKKILDMIAEIAAWEDITEDEYEEELEEDSEELALMDEEELNKKKEAAKKKLLEERKQKYEKFYEEFGKAIKLGILEDKTNRKKLASLSRWHTTRGDALVSFDEYIKRMKSVQDQIYFFSGEDRSVLEKSPLVVGLVRKGYEVLLCDDPIDQYVFNVLREYEGKNIVNVGKGDFKMPDDGERERKVQKFLAKRYQPYVEFAKKVLFEKVNNVVISSRLTNEPCVVVADTYGYSSFMDKIQKAQMFNSNNDGNPTSDFKKILEINPHHRVNQIILDRINENATDTATEELVELLYETAAFHSGFAAQDSNEFVRRFYQVYSKAMGVISLERKEVDVGEVELGDEDFEGDNEDIIRVNPSDIKVESSAEE